MSCDPAQGRFGAALIRIAHLTAIGLVKGDDEARAERHDPAACDRLEAACDRLETVSTNLERRIGL